MATATLDELDGKPTHLHLKAIISNLYMLIVQAHDYQGQGTQQAMTNEIKRLLTNIVELTKTSRRLPTHIPMDIIEYVEAGRNPDVYNREFVELVMRMNQQQKGRSEAFAQFRDILGREMMSAIPDISDDVRKVLQASGGKVE